MRRGAAGAALWLLAGPAQAGQGWPVRSGTGTLVHLAPPPPGLPRQGGGEEGNIEGLVP